LLEFISFCIKEARQCHVDSEELRAHFHAIDRDGSGGLDLSEFEEFLTNMVCMTEIEAEEQQEEIQEEHQNGRLTMQESLKVYITQQVRLHRLAAKGATDSPCPTMIPLDGAGLLERQRLAIDHLTGSMKPDAKRVLDFWFPASLTDAMMLWFGKSPSLDAEIEAKFGDLVEKAAKGDLDEWTSDPCECLALLILLDQFPRNIFRHMPKMYDTDAKAQSVCMKVLYHNFHRTISPLQAIFMPCLVLTHSEHYHHQELCVDIWCHLIQHSLPADDPLRIFGMIFLNHLKVVARFGRFPHRNEILGRVTTAEEREFLNDKSFRFDLPLHYTDDGKVVFEETEDFATKSRNSSSSSGSNITAASNTVDSNSNTQTRTLESDSPELRKCLFTTVKNWRKRLEDKFSGTDVDKVIEKRSGKSAVVESAAPQASLVERGCPEIEFQDKEAAAAAPAASTEINGAKPAAAPAAATPAASAPGRRRSNAQATPAQKVSRKEMMAQLLRGNQ